MSSVKKDKEKNASKDMPDFVHLQKNFERRIPEKYFVRMKKKSVLAIIWLVWIHACYILLDTYKGKLFYL